MIVFLHSERGKNFEFLPGHYIANLLNVSAVKMDGRSQFTLNTVLIDTKLKSAC